MILLDIVILTTEETWRHVVQPRDQSFFFLEDLSISWSSKRQTCVALSTTEAEFIAATEATKEAVWFQRLLTELGRPQRTTQLRCDNQGAIALVNNPVFHQRTKHMDIRFFFIREAQEEGKIDINYINTDEQLADIFTKALASPRFSKLCNLLNIVEIPECE